MSRYGNVANYTTCNNECRAKNLRPFQMQDFYNYDDPLNDTNFLDENYTEHFHSNITESLPKFGTISNDEEFELCTNVQFDFENRIWTDESAPFNFIHKWEVLNPLHMKQIFNPFNKQSKRCVPNTPTRLIR